MARSGGSKMSEHAARRIHLGQELLQLSLVHGQVLDLGFGLEGLKQLKDVSERIEHNLAGAASA